MAEASSADCATRQRIVDEARSWIGTPYHDQASRKGAGCDCLGLVRGVWRAVMGPEPEALPPYSRDWSEVSGEETLLAVARRHFTEIDPADAGPGDILVFRMRAGRVAKHCGVLVAPGRFVHAQERVPVSEASLGPWWRRRVVATFRFPDSFIRRNEREIATASIRNHPVPREG